MRYRYYFCDVFTSTRFGGNPLAVLPEAEGLSTSQMQQIAREFNFSETAFVFPAEAGHTRKVRIFTPVQEIPFAGHPNIGTAFVLAQTGELDASGEHTEVVFEEAVGPVSITLSAQEGGRIYCELTAPQALEIGASVDPEMIADAVSLAANDIVTDTHPPRQASVGLPFVFAELVDRDALRRAAPDLEGMRRLQASGVTPDVHLYVSAEGEFDLLARMFAPLDGVPEDPATGSANCALAGFLSRCRAEDDGEFGWRIAQGVEMGRPSALDTRVEKRDGEVAGIWIGGDSVMVSEGYIEVD